jgi:OST-HTH/LOTUS domain
VGAKFDIADAERLVVEAMEESPDASATGSWLKSKMLALDPAFDERNYGSKSFRVLLSRLPNLVEVKKDRSSPDMRVTLIAPRQAASPDISGPPEPAAGGNSREKAPAARRSTRRKAAQSNNT